MELLSPQQNFQTKTKYVLFPPPQKTDLSNTASDQVHSRTRMHSSRMRTVRSLPEGGGLCLVVSLSMGGLCDGGLCQGDPPDRDPLKGT